ncbi:HlyD family type I secretion periplasmic adaptor subunit [Marinivivus vitaminiproducens]|uniref:HlyD family type I secretion periplasmic adaptor subunit n=1 Tax=Marinivivus vitaminiproducens TaxID=3035935 RepID=UPI0027A3903D|nr:HlyD family type I secretion periplasmic adaptor subunit [Geminicoccaceae bacterium SCSIO 64248]
MLRRARRDSFLPEADGLIAGRHSPIAALTIMVVTGLTVATFTWSAMAEVEQVVRGTGRVTPAGRVKIVNHPRGGVVAAIAVDEGETVRAGQVLLTFAARQMDGAMAEVRGQYEVRAAEAARLDAEADGDTTVPGFPAELRAARPDLVAAETGLLQSRRAARADLRAALASAVQKAEGQIATLSAEETTLRNEVGLLRQQVDAVAELVAKGLYPRLKQVDIQRQMSEARGELSKAGEAGKAARAALDEARARQASFDSDSRSRLLAERGAARAERDRLEAALRQHRTLIADLELKAPVDGIVQGIQVAAPGQSVAANAPLMRLVPLGEGLVVDARIANQDIGDVRVGQRAVVKVRAYDFARHGALEGEVVRVDPDATVQNEGETPTYGIRVMTAKGYLGGDPSAQPVVPGMMVDVELNAGERTVLSYLTDRIFKVREEAFRDG